MATVGTAGRVRTQPAMEGGGDPPLRSQIRLMGQVEGELVMPVARPGTGQEGERAEAVLGVVCSSRHQKLILVDD